MKIHEEVLSPRQKNLARRIGPALSRQGFYLAGGTALALMVGHRHSVDFDYFIDDPMNDPQSVIETLRKVGCNPIVEILEKGTVHVTWSSVRMSFITYRYPMLQPFVEWKEGGCRLASLDDIACMKLSALAQRGSKKDFIDAFALIRKHKPLSDLLQLYQKKFDVSEIVHVLYGLSYFDDADKERSPRMLWDVSWKEIKKKLTEHVRNLSP